MKNRCIYNILDHKTKKKRKCKKNKYLMDLCKQHYLIELGKNKDDQIDNVISFCCFCGVSCNPCSQSCGKCAREITLISLGYKNLK